VEFQATIDRLRERFMKPLPGWEAQKRMAPASRTRLPADPGDARSKSGVLLLLYPHETRPRFLMIERSEGGAHSGQIGLPGGKFEPRDVTLRQTALREAEEETGIDASRVQLLGALTDLYIPVSRYHVFPQVGWVPERPAFTPNPAEVRRLIEADLAPFLGGALVGEGQFETSYGPKAAPCFEYEGYRIWGATSMILSEFIQMMQ
jgi:8-oxo-dGTP pyrophosphatase MutT (NUDIX family)